MERGETLKKNRLGKRYRHNYSGYKVIKMYTFTHSYIQCTSIYILTLMINFLKMGWDLP